MSPRTDDRPQGPVLVVHPSSDLYGADRMLLESVRQLVDVHGDVVVAVPGPGPLVPRLLEAGARVLGGGEPKIGAHGKPVLFLHPKDFNGTLVELEQA